MSPQKLLTEAGQLFVIFMAPSLGGLVPIALAIAQPAMAEHFGGGSEGTLLARLLLSAPSLMIILGTSFGGYAIAWFGLRRSLLVALTVYGIMGGAGLFLDDFSSLLATRLVLGAAGGAILTIYLSLAAELYAGEARARVLGFAVACASLFGMLALAIGGWLVDRGGWHAPFGLYLLAFAVLPVAWAVIHPSRPAAGQTDRAQVPLSAMLRLVARFWPVYLVLITLSIGTFMPSSGGPFLLKEHDILSGTEQGLILSVGPSTGIVAAISYGFLRRYLGDRPILAITASTMAAGLIAAVPLESPSLLLVAFAVVGIGTGFKAPSAASLLLGEAPPSVRAEAAGLGLSSIFLGQFLAPMVIQALDGLVGIQGSFYLVGGALALIPLAVVFGGLGAARASVDVEPANQPAG